MSSRIRATALDVARLAGVSQPTVSRVFTRDSGVSSDLRDKVEAAARQLGYRPNKLARSLIEGRTRTIGLVLAYLKNPFYAEALEKLSLAFKELGYHILIVIAANLEEEVDGVVEDLMDRQVDGIILASVSHSNSLTRRLRETGVPFILFNRGQEDTALSSVTAANYEGGLTAGRFLAAAGHKRIAHIAGWRKSLNGRQRQAGFVDGLAEFGLDPVACIDSHYRRVVAAEATRELFAQDDRPDAVFVGNDHMAFAVMEVLREELSLNVPGDVSVVGYDDVGMAAWPTFELTTLRQPVNRMVDATVELLMSMIDGKVTEPRQVTIESELIIRGSAKIPDTWPAKADN